MKRKGALLVLWWVTLGSAAAAPGPRAPAPSAVRGAGGPSARIVTMMAARGQEAAVRELHRAVGAQLSDTSVTLALHWVDGLGRDLRAELLQARRLARGPGVAVVFWCDLAGSDDVYIYLSEPGGGRLLVRAVPQGAGSARAESMAIIVGASVRAFLQAGAGRARALVVPRPGAQTGPGPGARPASGPPGRPAQGAGTSGALAAEAGGPRGSPSVRGPPVALPGEGRSEPSLIGRSRPRRPPRLSLELGYATDTYNGANAPLHGARLALTLALSGRVSMFVSYRVLQAIRGRVDDVEVGLQRNPVSLGGIFHFRWGRWVLGISAAMVADYVATEARAALGSGAALGRPASQGDWQVLAAAGLVGGIEVVDRLWVELGLGAEFVLYSRGYYVLVPEATGYRKEPLLRPWVVQPYGVLGLRLEIL